MWPKSSSNQSDMSQWTKKVILQNQLISSLLGFLIVTMWKPLNKGTCDAETDRVACVKQISSQSRDAEYIPIMPLTAMPFGWGLQQDEEVHTPISARGFI